ncbi:MAG: hypothetical protein ACFFCW_22855 [Candidatus Hodarchaeota archaeon]
MNGPTNGSGRNPPIGIILDPPLEDKDKLTREDEKRFHDTVDFLAKKLGVKPCEDPKHTNGFIMRGSEGKWYNLEEVVRKIVEWILLHEEKDHEKP